MKKINLNILDTKDRVIPCWLIAFGVNLIAAILAIGPFLIRDHGYFAMSHDFTAQEIAFNMLMNDTVKSGNLLWNWGIDLGGNFLESFSFYNVGSIFFWISLIFPAEWIPRVLGFLLILKFAVAGAASAAYFSRHLKNRTIVIMASLLYAFCGFQCSSVVFYHFQDVVALFPLMLVGLEQLIEEKKRGRLAAACILNVLCNYVFFVGEVLFLVLYYVVKYMIPDIKARKRGFKTYAQPVLACIAEGAIGMAVSGALVIPAIHGTMANSRISSHIAGQDWLGMTTSEWLMLIKAFFTPAEPMNYVSGVKGADWMTNAAYLPLFGMIFVVAYVLSKKDWISNILKICLVIAVVPVLNSVFMFFSPEAYRRWFYMLIMIMALATAKVAENPKEYKIKQGIVLSVLMLVLYVGMTKFVNWDGKGGDAIWHEKEYLIVLAVAAAGIVVTCMILLLVRRYREQVFCAAAALFSIGVLMLSVHGYQTTTDNTNLDFKTYKNSYAENVANYMTEIAGQFDPDVFPYRYYIDEGIGHTYYNMAMTNSLPSINSFISTVHASVTEFYDILGVGRTTWTNAAARGSRELLSARYIISNIEQTDYTYIRSIENKNGQVMNVYENENALPIGFTYDTYVLRSKYEQLDADMCPIAMLTTLVIEDEDEETVSRYLRPYDIDTDGLITQESLAPSLAARRAESSESFETGDNYFEAVITAGNDKYAFFSVPYDKSWKAAVNGEEAEVININGLMAVFVHEGTNVIRFDYEYTPLKLGVICSISGIAVFACYMVICRIGAKKKDR